MSNARENESAPRVWCLLGRKAGDNTQLRALAQHLGWPWEEKRIVARPWELLPHLLLGSTLAGIDRRASSALEAPWPDLVLSAGRRNEPVAHWIRAQSGGVARLVQMGRPWSHPSRWDLIVTTPQYCLPEATNILHNRLPLHDPDEEALEREATLWRDRWQAALPRPWIGVLMGGDSGPFVVTETKGQRLGALAGALAVRSAGSVLFTDSARTPPAAGDACAAAIHAPAHLYRSASGPAENPYRAILALADAFIVTGESMSMIAEAYSRGRPLFLFDLGDAPPWWGYGHAFRAKPLSHHLAMRWGPLRMRRDIGRIQRALIADGAARWLDDASAEQELPRLPAHGGESAQEELARTVSAVRGLFGGG